LAHSPRIADQLTLEWGVYPTNMPVAENVDALIDTALLVARDYAGLSSGARVVLTAGRRAGTPGATNLIMVREIP
jgi:pyruvate kinase